MEEKTIGRYLVVREIGRGGMGVVYLATDPAIGREVAVKMLELYGFTPDQAREIKERFQREAMAAGRLNDPHIVTVYDIGEHNGEYFIAMEYVPGRSLEDILEEDALMSHEKILEIVEGIAAALDHAHSKGIVHRDVKPANILLPDKGGVRVTDFGIARIENLRITREGAMLGSPSYMSPEQIMGKEIDGRSDVFSLGVILYMMLTGEKPFPGESLATLSYRIVQEEPTPVSQLCPGLNLAFDAVIAKALAKDPGRRYSTAGELAADLKRIVESDADGDGGTLIVKTMPSARSNSAIKYPSYPSITAIPVSGEGGDEDETEEMAVARKRPPYTYVLLGLLAAVILAGAAFLGRAYLPFIGKSGPGGPSGIPTGDAPKLPPYKPLGIVPRPYILWREASKAIKANDVKMALPLLKELELITPADAEVQLELGKVYHGAENDPDAINKFTRALQLDPDLKKDPKLVTDLIEIMGSKSARNSKEAMGVLAGLVGDPAEKALIEAAASQDPVMSRNALTALTDLWAKRLRNKPKDVETRVHLARTLFQLGNYADSIEAYRQALIDRPEEKTNPELIINLVEMLDTGKAENAGDVLVRLVGPPAVPTLESVTPDKSRRMRSNAFEALKKILANQTDAEPRNSEAPLKLALLLAGQENYNEAWPALSTALERNPALAADLKVQDLLIRALSMENPGMALDILTKKMGEQALPIINKALSSDNHNARWNAVKALKTMGKGDTIDMVKILILDLLGSDTTCQQRKDAAEALSKTSDPRATKALWKALDDPEARRCGKNIYRDALQKPQ